MAATFFWVLCACVAVVQGFSARPTPLGGRAGQRPAFLRSPVPVLAEPQMQVMEVEVPPGMQGGMMLQVQTPAGLMEVQIPQGLQAGQAFTMQVPIAQPQPVAQQPVMATPPPLMSTPPPLVMTPPSAMQQMSTAVGDAAVNSKLGADVAAFRAKQGVGGTAMDQDDGEVTLLQKTINTLGKVLTFNFFVIIIFFIWFITGALARTFRTWRSQDAPCDATARRWCSVNPTAAGPSHCVLALLRASRRLLRDAGAP